MIIAGPNGSGKSTLLERGELLAHGISLPRPPFYINADDIAKTLHAEGFSASQEEIEWEAFHQARFLRQTYRDQGVSYAFETVFSHPSTLLDMQKCLDAGYEVVLVFVVTGNSEINVARVEGRVRQGGHNVEAAKIRSRYERSLHYLPRAVELASHAIVFDSTQEQQMRLCFQKRRFVTVRNLPPYLQIRLTAILNQRRVEREAISSCFGTAVLPDEEAGEYAGPVRFAGSSYVMQETRPDHLILHDRLLFPAGAPMADDTPEDTPVRIYYRQGEGQFVPVPDPV